MRDRSPRDHMILAVDDSASVRKLVELTLRREGLGVVAVDSGLAALAATVEHRPDLILLDVMLASLDGFQICRAIRRHPDYEKTPIVILSGRESPADREAGISSGVNDYLAKPFRPDQLMTVVRQQLSSASREPA